MEEFDGYEETRLFGDVLLLPIDGFATGYRIRDLVRVKWRRAWLSIRFRGRRKVEWIERKTYLALRLPTPLRTANMALARPLEYHGGPKFMFRHQTISVGDEAL